MQKRQGRFPAIETAASRENQPNPCRKRPALFGIERALTIVTARICGQEAVMMYVDPVHLLAFTMAAMLVLCVAVLAWCRDTQSEPRHSVSRLIWCPVF